MISYIKIIQKLKKIKTKKLLKIWLYDKQQEYRIGLLFYFLHLQVYKW
jgi:hypothetical protein